MKPHDVAELAQTLFEEMGDAAFIANPETMGLVDVNPVAQRMTGLTRTELLRIPLDQLFRSDASDAGLAHLRRALQTTQTFHSQEGYRLRHGTGETWIPVNLTLTRLHTEPGPLGLVLARDITERIEADERLRHANAELERRVQEKTADLKQANEALRAEVVGHQRAEEALREREELYRLLTDNSNDLIYLVDLEGRIVYASPSVARLLGRVPAHKFEVVHPDDVEMGQQYWKKILAGAAGLFNVRVRAGDGTWHWLEAWSSLVRHQGQTLILSVCRDVTARVQSEETLRVSERQYRLLFERNMAGVLRNTPDGIVLEHNGAFARILGYEPGADLTKYNANDFYFRSADRQAMLAQLRAKRSLSNYEICFRRKDGTPVWVLANIVLYEDEQNRETVQGTVIDITERKRAEESVRRSEASLARAQRIAHLGDWEQELFPDRLRWSDEVFRIFGIDPKEFSGTSETFFRHVPPDDAETIRAAVVEAIRLQQPYSIDHRIVRPDGSVRYVHEYAEPVYEAGQAVALVGTVQDITERKLAEEERQGHLWFLESMDKVNRAIQGTNDLEQMVSDVLGTVFTIFNCDRAWLVYPCDPEASSWRSVVERTRPEYPGAFATGAEVPMDPEVAGAMRLLTSVPGPVQFGPGCEYPVPAVASEYDVLSFIAMAVQPKIDKPYMFGLHQCSYPRVWMPQEERLFQEIGRRLADALSSLLLLRDLRQSEVKLEEAQRIAHVGHWDYDIDTGRSTWSNETYHIFGLRPQEHLIDVAMVQEQLHPEDRQRQVRAVAEALKGGARYDIEYRIVRPSGEVRIIHSQGDVRRDKYGWPRRMFGTVQDITERKRAEEALALFRSLIDRVTDSIEVIDPETARVLDVNATACAHHGYTREEYLSLTIPDLDPTMNGPDVWARQVEHLRRAGSGIHEGWHRRKDGSLFPVEVHVTYIRDNREYLVAVVRDISDRKRAEEALRQSQRQYRELVAHIDGIVWEADVQTLRFTFVSQQAERLLGYPIRQWQDEPDFWVNHIHPDDREWATEYCLRAVEDHRNHDFEYRMVAATGRVLWLRDIVSVVIEEDKPVKLRGIMVDVTDRQLAEERLQESHALLNAVVEGTSDAVFVKDVQGRYLMINTAGAKFLGKTVSDVLGKDDRELFSPDTARAIMEGDRRVMAGGGTQTYEEVGTAAGVTRTYLATKAPYRDATGRITGLIGISRDITERKKLEEQYRQSQKMEAVGRLAGGVAHDFNNLLTVINGYGEFLMTEMSSTDPRRESMSAIREAGMRAAELTGQLLAFSRKAIVSPKVLDFNEVVDSIGKMLRRLIGEDITLITSLAPGLWKVKADPGQVEQVIMNLAVNARDAMPKGGRLMIETTNLILEPVSTRYPELEPGRYVQLGVSDTGVGMTEEVKSRIFEPFFTTKELGKGTGLGLATVYGIVKTYGGYVGVESEVGVGTTLRVLLPTTQDVPSGPLSGVGMVAPRGTETILLVEDDEGVRRFTRIALEAQGYTVLDAGGGAEAVRVARAHPGSIHLLLTDVVMPDQGGREVADAVRIQRLGLKVLYMSGYTDDAIVRHGIHEATDGFLQKPFTPLGLARKVREVLDRTA